VAVWRTAPGTDASKTSNQILAVHLADTEGQQAISPRLHMDCSIGQLHLTGQAGAAWIAEVDGEQRAGRIAHEDVCMLRVELHGPEGHRAGEGRLCPSQRRDLPRRGDLEGCDCEGVSGRWVAFVRARRHNDPEHAASLIHSEHCPVLDQAGLLDDVSVGVGDVQDPDARLVVPTTRRVAAVHALVGRVDDSFAVLQVVSAELAEGARIADVE
jgi:hypothetical protein